MKYIRDLGYYREGVPEFKGATKQEASEFIQQYKNYPPYIDEDEGYMLFPDEGSLC